LSGELE
jgi:hypothetical protein